MIYPKISIVTPSYNQGRYLEKTILSVLEQGYPNLEYIIIDGGSTDESVDIIRKYADRLTYWVSEPDLGQSHAINKGFARATGEIFAWLNSDDWYHPGALHKVAEVFAANPEAGAVVGAGDMVDEEGSLILYKEGFAATVDKLYHWSEEFFWQPSCFFPRESWRQCGPLDQDLHYALDLDLWFKIADRYRFATTPALLSHSLKHENAKTTELDILSIIEAAIVISLHGGKSVAGKSLKEFVVYLKSREQDCLWQISSREDQLAYKDSMLEFKDWQLSEKDRQLEDLTMRYEGLLNSGSWKVTEPLRWLDSKINSLVKKVRVQSDPMGDIGGINIAIQLESFDKGGLEEVVYGLIKSIVKDKSFNLYVFVNDDKLGYLGSEAEAEGFRIILLKNDTNYLKELVRKLNIRLVNLHYSLFGVDIYAANNVRMVYTVHNSYIWADKAFVKQRSAAYRKIDRFIAVSDQAGEFFTNRFKVAKEKIITIPNGLDLHSLQSIEPIQREEFNLAPDDFVFINVSSFNWNKFHILMVAAMEQLIKKHQNIKMIFVGNVADPECYNYICNEIEINDLSKYIQIVDYVPKAKVLGLMGISDCFLLPSLIEGWSIALMEAMYMELPLIVSDIGSARNVIIDDDIGIVIPNPYKSLNEMAPADIYSDFTGRNNLNNLILLCESMLDIYENRAEWKEKAKKGKQKVIERFNVDQMTQEYLASFKSMF